MEATMTRSKLTLASVLLAASVLFTGCPPLEDPYYPTVLECWSDWDCPYDMYCTDGGFCRYANGCFSDYD